MLLKKSEIFFISDFFVYICKYYISSYRTVAEEYMAKRQKEIDELEESEVK